jgi:uncharacterized protein DUF1761
VPDFSHVSWVAVIVAAVVQIVLGYIWYMPMVFGKRWEMATGKTLLATPTPMQIGSMVISALLAAVGMALWFSGGTLTDGVIWGALVWLYFVVPATLGVVTFEGRSWMWWYIAAGYWLVGLMIMGAIVNVIH